MIIKAECTGFTARPIACINENWKKFTRRLFLWRNEDDYKACTGSNDGVGMEDMGLEETLLQINQGMITKMAFFDDGWKETYNDQEMLRIIKDFRKE